jgi:hypothetical protein
MGGAAALNIFKHRQPSEPPEVLNWRLWFAVFSFGIMGAARGIDEGLISGTMSRTHFIRKLHLDVLSTEKFAQTEGNIAAMVQIGSAAGCLLYDSAGWRY